MNAPSSLLDRLVLHALLCAAGRTGRLCKFYYLQLRIAANEPALQSGCRVLEQACSGTLFQATLLLYTWKMMAFPRPIPNHSSAAASVMDSPRSGLISRDSEAARIPVSSGIARASSGSQRSYVKGTEGRRFSAFSARMLKPLKMEGIGAHAYQGQENAQKGATWFSDRRSVRTRHSTDSRAVGRPPVDDDPVCPWTVDHIDPTGRDDGMCTVCLGLPARRRRCSAPTQSAYVRRRASCTFWPARVAGKGRTRSSSCVCPSSRDLGADLRLPIPVRRTIQEGPRGPNLSVQARKHIGVCSRAGLTPHADGE